MKKSDYSQIKRLQAAEKLLYGSHGGDISAGILVPNPYKIAVVGLSSHILIKLAGQNGASVDRFYSDAMRSGLRAWAGGRQASELDILLCSVSYEPDLLVLADMLKQAGIAPLADERREDDPIVAVGGVAVLGAPQLAAQIGDVVCWGEAETIVPPLLAKLKGSLDKDRSEIIDQLTVIDGIKAGGEEIAVDDNWRYYPEFKDNPGHSVIVTPYGEFGASFLVELVRGCPHGCRHCFACRAQSPFRCADPDVVVGLAADIGSEKIGLVGLGVASHPQLLTILEALCRLGKKLATASLTAEELSLDTMKQITRMGQRTLTISPEAGSEGLRQSIGKMAGEAEWVKIAENACEAGFKSLRLYFMVGLPAETDEDLLGIGVLVNRIGSAFRGKLAITLAPFVPKPYTPWQHLVPSGEVEWSRRLSIVRSGMAGCTVRVESPRQAMQQWRLSQLTGAEANKMLRESVG